MEAGLRFGVEAEAKTDGNLFTLAVELWAGNSVPVFIGAELECPPSKQVTTSIGYFSPVIKSIPQLKAIYRRNDSFGSCYQSKGQGWSMMLGAREGS